MAVFEQLRKYVLFSDVLRLQFDIQAVFCGDFEKIELFSDLRDDKAEIKTVRFADCNALKDESISKYAK